MPCHFLRHQEGRSTCNIIGTDCFGLTGLLIGCLLTFVQHNWLFWLTNVPLSCFVKAFAVLVTLTRSVLYPFAHICVYIYMSFIIFYGSGNTGSPVLFTALYVRVCMLTSLCDIFLLAMQCVYVHGLAFCYICLFICFICCILSLLNCTELPTWLLGWFADLLVTWLLTCNGRVGWLAGCPFG